MARSLKMIACLMAVMGIAFVNAVSPKPHVVFIMADDLGWNDVGYHGNSEITTPNIDDLAGRGVRLERYYVGPTCGPTRSQFLSGRYAIHLGLHDSNLGSCSLDALPTQYETVANHMKSSGYSTHIIGKWHAGFYSDAHIPTNRGFDTFRGFLASHGDHYTHSFNYNDGTTKTLYHDYHDNENDYTLDDGTYSTTAFTARAKELIAAHDVDDPMFMYLSYQAPHSPFEGTQSFANQYNSIPTIAEQRQSYSGMVSEMDSGIGEVVQALKDANMYDNTVIIFSSDNGPPAKAGSSYPLKGRKGTYYEGGIRAVGFVSSELIPTAHQNRNLNSLVHVTDWLPTFVSIAGGTVNSSLIDGINQWGTIQNGEASQRNEILHNIERKQGSNGANIPFRQNIAAAITVGNYKLLTGTHKHSVNYPNPRDDYTAWLNSFANPSPKTDTTKLFDVVADPNERIDLSGNTTFDVIKNDMLQKLRTYQRGMHDAIVDGSSTDCDPSLRSDGAWGPWI